MVSETKAKVIYRELLKEDLVIIRLLPEGECQNTNRSILDNRCSNTSRKKIVRRAYSIASHAENRDYFNLKLDG